MRERMRKLTFTPCQMIYSLTIQISQPTVLFQMAMVISRLPNGSRKHNKSYYGASDLSCDLQEFGCRRCCREVAIVATLSQPW